MRRWKALLRRKGGGSGGTYVGPKVFGIGLPKTGTTSLNAALRELGLRSVHFPHDSITVKELRTGEYHLSVLRENDAISDIPVPAIYPQLDEAFPESKFILTIRDIDSWLESCRKAWFNQADAFPKAGSMREFYRTLLYGCNTFHEGRFRWVFRTHHRSVYEYFVGEKEKQLLILDVRDVAAWEKLSAFLELDVPEVPFPHLNRESTASQSVARSVRGWSLPQ